MCVCDVRVCESVYGMEKRAIGSSGGQVEKQTQSSFDSSTCPQLENKTYDPPRKKNPLNMEIYSIFFAQLYSFGNFNLIIQFQLGKEIAQDILFKIEMNGSNCRKHLHCKCRVTEARNQRKKLNGMTELMNIN